MTPQASAPCPAWEYADSPGVEGVLRGRAASLIQRLLTPGLLDAVEVGRDTRPVHVGLFHGLTPPNFDWYAGNYRGVSLPCLDTYEVTIGADRLVGTPARGVASAMDQFGRDLEAGIRALDAQFLAGGDPVDHLLRTVRLAALLFTGFLTIHPYANGNGHLARFLVWLVLGRWGLRPERWTIEPRPSTALYSDAISAHRRGRTSLLEKLILESLVP